MDKELTIQDLEAQADALLAAADEMEELLPADTSEEIHALVPLSEMFGYSTALRSRTQGRGVYTMQPEHYEPVPKSIQEKVCGTKAAK